MAKLALSGTEWVLEELDEIKGRVERLYQKVDSLNEAERSAIAPSATASKIESLPEEQIAELFRSLGHADRIKILKKLLKNGKYFTEIMNEMDLSQSPLYFHLNLLQETGYVSQEYTRGRYLITTLGIEALRTAVHLHRFGRGKK